MEFFYELELTNQSVKFKLWVFETINQHSLPITVEEGNKII